VDGLPPLCSGASSEGVLGPSEAGHARHSHTEKGAGATGGRGYARPPPACFSGRTLSDALPRRLRIRFERRSKTFPRPVRATPRYDARSDRRGAGAKAIVEADEIANVAVTA
jgi:hypothetical protein